MQLQLSFSLRVSSSIKQVHLLGSWDNYQEHIPLSKDKSSSKTWSGTFRFPADLVQPGQRYWYYYVLDGYHLTYNPQEQSTVEPTTGRELNILDVPASGSSSTSSSSKHKSKSSSSSSSAAPKGSSRHSSSTTSGSGKRRHRTSMTVDIPKGLPLPQSQIVSPRPISPKTPRHILDAEEEELRSRLAQTGLYDKKGRPRSFDKFRVIGDGVPGVNLDDDEVLYDYYYYDDDFGTTYEVVDGIARQSSATSSNGPAASISSSASGGTFSSSGSPASSTLSWRSNSSSPSTNNGSKSSSISGYSTPDSESSGCTCGRFGITRKGERVRIDCGGTRCGYEDSCSSSDDDGAAARGGSRAVGLGVSYAGTGAATGGSRRNGVIVTR